MLPSLSSATPTSTNSTPSYTLTEAVTSVTQGHPLITARRFELSAERYGVTAAEGLLDPILSLNVESNSDLMTFVNPPELGGVSELITTRHNAELSLSQPLRWGTVLAASLSERLVETDNPFRNCIPGLPSERCYEARLTLSLTQPLLRGRSAEVNATGVKVAQEATRAAKLRVRLQLEALVYEVASAYGALMLSEAQRGLEERAYALAAQQLSEGEARAEAGLLARSDLAPLRLALAQRSQGKLEAERALGEARAALKRLTGVTPTGSLSLPLWATAQGAAPLPSEPPLEQHPELALLDAQRAQLNAQLTSRRDEALPELNASLVWSQSGLGEDLKGSLEALPENKSRFYGATLSLRYGLSQRPKALIQQALARREALEAERRDTLARLEQTWAQRVAERPLLIERLKQAHLAAEAAQEGARAARERLEVGRVTRFEVEQRQEAAHRAALSVAQATHALFTHHLDALRLSGGLLPALNLELKDP
jgi:outer membrane protein TolC